MDLKPLSPLQRAIIAHATSGPTLLNVPGSVRAGKTTACSIGHASYVVANPTVEHAIIGYSEDTVLRNVVRAEIGTLAYLRALGIDADVSHRDGLHVEFYLNAVRVIIWLWGGGNDTAVNRIAGATLGSILFDEVTRILEDVFLMAWSRLSREEAKVWSNMNTKGSQHWYRQQVLLRPDRYDQQLLTARIDRGDNPSMTEKALQRISAGLYGHQYKRDIEAEWADPAGLIWPHWTKASRPAPEEIQQWSISLDWASSGVLHALAHAHTAADRSHVASEHRHDATDHGVLTDQEHADRIEHWSTVTIGAPATGLLVTGDPNTSAGFKKLLRQKGFRWQNAKNDVDFGLKKTGIALASGLVTIDDVNCPELTKEISGYSWDEKAAAKGEDKPIKSKDHGCDALRYRVATKRAAAAPARSGIWSR